jgi:hypothetical protein
MSTAHSHDQGHHGNHAITNRAYAQGLSVRPRLLSESLWPFYKGSPSTADSGLDQIRGAKDERAKGRRKHPATHSRHRETDQERDDD